MFKLNDFDATLNSRNLQFNLLPYSILLNLILHVNVIHHFLLHLLKFHFNLLANFNFDDFHIHYMYALFIAIMILTCFRNYLHLMHSTFQY